MSKHKGLIITLVLGLLIFCSFFAASFSIYRVSQDRDSSRADVCIAINDGRANDRFFYQALLSERDLEEDPLTPSEEKLVEELFERTDPLDCAAYIRTGRFPK